MELLGWARKRSSENNPPIFHVGDVFNFYENGTLFVDWSRWTGSVEPPQDASSVNYTPGTIKQFQVLSGDFHFWINQLKLPPIINRKWWEYFRLLHAIHTHGFFEKDETSVIGFGVGNEPIPSYLASRGVKVMATDYFEGNEASAWNKTSQLLDYKKLNEFGLCEISDFQENVVISNMDMNEIPNNLSNKFDVCYSLCSLGHIGGYEQSIKFIFESLKVLKPGGIAVHTLEMEIDDSDRYERPEHTIFLKRDLEDVIKYVKNKGYTTPKHDFNQGVGYLDQYLDVHPYGSSPHLFLNLSGRRSLPAVLIIEKPNP